MCASWDLCYFISTSGSRSPSLIFHLPWRCPVLTFVQICCSKQKICGFRWNFTYNAYCNCNIKFFPHLRFFTTWKTKRALTTYNSNKYFRFHVCYFDFRLNSHRIVPRAPIYWPDVNLSAAVTSASSKTNAQRWICFQRWFTPFDSMVIKFIKFSPKNHPNHLHYRLCKLLTG